MTDPKGMPVATPTVLRRAVALFLAAGLAASVASAQPTAPPREDPERVAEELRRRADAATLRAGGGEVLIPPVQPPSASGPHPGVTRGVDWLAGLDEAGLDVPRPTVLPERSFLTSRGGTVLPGPFGTWIFVPGAANRLPGERAMLLLPSRVTQRIAAAAGQEARLPVEVSGEVFVYHGRNYVLPSAFRVARPGVGPAPDPGVDEAEAGPAPAERVPPGDTGLEVDAEADVAGLIAELRAQRGARDDGEASRPVGAETPEPGGGASAADLAGLVSEGEMITQRRGRIERSTDGLWTFVTDNDADGQSGEPSDTSMRLLPCGMLMRIEATAEFEGDLRAVSLSGRATVYDGQNFLLPLLFRVERGTEVQPLQ